MDICWKFQVGTCNAVNCALKHIMIDNDTLQNMTADEHILYLETLCKEKDIQILNFMIQQGFQKQEFAKLLYKIQNYEYMNTTSISIQKELANKIDQSENSRKKLAQENSSLKIEVTVKSNKLDQLMKSSGGIYKEIYETEKKINDKLQEELKRVSVEFTKNKKELKRIMDGFENKDKELIKIKDELNKIKKEIENKDKELNATKDELKTVKNELSREGWVEGSMNELTVVKYK